MKTYLSLNGYLEVVGIAYIIPPIPIESASHGRNRQQVRYFLRHFVVHFSKGNIRKYHYNVYQKESRIQVALLQFKGTRRARSIDPDL